MNIFDFMYEPLRFDKNKPIKLFEAFSGYGSQYMALKRLGVKVDVVGYSEIDKFAIQVYEALHGKHKNYGGIGSFDRLPRDIDICTWSFPCQDISLAGKQRGMEDGSRSNYGYVFLDTVEATPYHERPKVLLMENVRALFSDKFKDDWREIQLRLERLGYTNYADVLNAKDYGVAQNRVRVFIVSILGEYNYNFPKPIPLTKRLKDYLEDKVDEKYYLSETMPSFFIENSKKNAEKGNGFRFKPHEQDTDKVAFAITTNTGNRMDDNFIKVKTWNDDSKVYKTKEEDMPRHRIYETDSIGFTITTNESQQPSIIIPEATKRGYAEAYDGDGVYINRPHQKRGVVQKGMIQTIKTSGADVGVVLTKPKIQVIGNYSPSGHDASRIVDEQGLAPTVKENHGTVTATIDKLGIRKLTPREALRLMDVEEHDIDIILATVSNTQAYKLAGNSIVVSVLVEIFRNLF